MRFRCCPVLTSQSTGCDVCPSGKVFTRCKATFLTLIIQSCPTHWNRAVLPRNVWVVCDAPDPTRISIGIPAVIMTFHVPIIVIHVPDLTSSSTCRDIDISQIAGTRWIAFLTLLIVLRSDRSVLSAFCACLSFPPFPCIRFPWPSGCPIISEEMARYKAE